MRGLGMPNPHTWSAGDEDWNLPENWEEIIYNALQDRLEKYRSLKVFMDVCVRCGACADKCHFFLGTGDPKNMPVLRAELLRSVTVKTLPPLVNSWVSLPGPVNLTKTSLKSGSTTSISAPNVVAVPFTVLTVSTQPK